MRAPSPGTRDTWSSSHAPGILPVRTHSAPLILLRAFQRAISSPIVLRRSSLMAGRLELASSPVWASHACAVRSEASALIFK